MSAISEPQREDLVVFLAAMRVDQLESGDNLRAFVTGFLAATSVLFGTPTAVQINNESIARAGTHHPQAKE